MRYIQSESYFQLNYQRFVIIDFIEMAKKVSKASKKPKLTRSSSIQKTIDEGKDYVTRADRRLRIRRVAQKPKPPAPKKVDKKAPTKKTTKIAKPAKPAKAKKPTKPRKSVTNLTTQPTRPGITTVPVPAPTLPPTPAVTTSKPRTSSKNSIIIEQELQDRLGRHGANIGKLNFSLRWWDPNDLDLHVICPCNTEISFMNKKCYKCGGQLDIDMNVGMNMSLEPVEHVYFNNPKSGLYKFYVQFYYGPKEFSGVKGAQTSKYALSLHEDMTQLFRYQDTVGINQRQMHYDFNR